MAAIFGRLLLGGVAKREATTVVASTAAKDVAVSTATKSTMLGTVGKGVAGIVGLDALTGSNLFGTLTNPLTGGNPNNPLTQVAGTLDGLGQGVGTGVGNAVSSVAFDLLFPALCIGGGILVLFLIKK
jgi:hypothetical protein